MFSLFKHQAPHDSAVEYHVKVPEYNGGEYDLVFSMRKDAVQYKRMLKASKRKLAAVVVRREYSGGFIVEEKAVA